jgi:predicted  nucleic acid-binding Zn-ribbon protein
MKLNDTVYANLVKSENIMTCPHCGRILYIPEEQEVQEETQA